MILLVGLPLVTGLLAQPRRPHSSELELGTDRRIRDWTRAEVLRDPAFYLLLSGMLVPAFIGTTIFFHQGHLIDRFGAVRLLPWFLAPIFIATIAAASITALPGIYLFMFLFGISYGLTSTMLGALWPEVYGIANLGAIRSIVISAMVLSTAIGPGLTGALIDRGTDLPEQLWWMAGWCVISTFALMVAARRIGNRLSGTGGGVSA